MPWNMNTDKTYSVILNVVATGVILIRTVRSESLTNEFESLKEQM